jgi:type I restriction-modification system DNA methylase subunit
LLRQDGRWHYGAPPTGNANFAWGHHVLSHLAPTGTAGLVLFIDASELGYMVNHRNRAFDEGDIQKIAGTYREWKLKGEL